jgi:phosphatidylserine decarboxylase
MRKRRKAVRTGGRLKELCVFLCGFLKEPIKVGTGLQSSRFLARKLDRALASLNLSDGCVAELGAGLGRLTERIVRRLGPTTRLLCFEREPMFAEHLRRKFAQDLRVCVVQGSAEELPAHLSRLGVSHVSAIVSAVPLSGRRNDTVLQAIRSSLREGGRVVQMALVRRRYFEGESFDYVGRHVCLLNLPPEVLHVCEKRSSAS